MAALGSLLLLAALQRLAAPQLLAPPERQQALPLTAAGPSPPCPARLPEPRPELPPLTTRLNLPRTAPATCT